MFSHRGQFAMRLGMGVGMGHQRLSTVWLLIYFFACSLLLYPLCTHSTPIHTRPRASHDDHGGDGVGAASCAHDSLAELIKTSPVIIKALGAHIFTDDDFNGMGLPMMGHFADELMLLKHKDKNNKNNNNNRGYSKQQQRNEFLTSATHEVSSSSSSSSSSSPPSSSPSPSTSTSKWRSREDFQIRKNSIDSRRASTNAITATISTEMDSILITLTPETIYKGSSLLKMSPGSENAARSNSAIAADLAAGGGATAAAGQNERQLNATLQPVHCFDSKLLQLLPTELIVFGKLVTRQQQELHQHQEQQEELMTPQEPQLHHQQQQQQQQLPHTTKSEDILHISINGLHRWSPQFENHIWKHLGWDDWSDFTLCSVTCGKGVQQRFRRCLLDNPMVDLHMNENLNAIDVNAGADDDDNDIEDDDIIIGDDDDDDADAADDLLADAAHEADTVRVRNPELNVTMSFSPTAATSNGRELKTNEENLLTIKPAMATDRNDFDGLGMGIGSTVDAETSTTITTNDELQHARPLTSMSDNKNNEHEHVLHAANIMNSPPNDNGNEVIRTTEYKMESHRKKTQQRKHGKSHKTTKTFSTMFCEGYNIEQRNCNTFECSDDISDLLKFYKRPNAYDEPSLSPASSTAGGDANTVTSLPLTARTDVITAAASAIDGAAIVSVNGFDYLNGVSASVLANSTPSTTPANMGYIRSWRNALNFTIMLTLRVKNDSKNTATIFSIRNATHNLYLDQCQDGLRLYLERDNSTEMLPVKFNLYDYRWHQVAISIQNGDFISIFVDCSWTNSFVVSKRLFTLPLDADAEIGRGFNGELQQLLLLPDNQERHQCSNKRTSINEVKRYIIDTFIGDYSN